MSGMLMLVASSRERHDEESGPLQAILKGESTMVIWHVWRDWISMIMFFVRNNRYDFKTFSALAVCHIGIYFTDTRIALMHC